MLPTAARRLALGALSVFVPACSDGTEYPGFDRRLESEHFVVYARPDDTSVRPELTIQLEHVAQLFADFLGVDEEQWAPVNYFKYSSRQDFEESSAPCGDNAGACAVDFSDRASEIHSPRLLDQHEIAHVVSSAWGDAPTFLSEGLSIAMTCEPAFEADLLRDGDYFRQELGTVYDDTDTWGETSGVFTSWLIDRFGVEPYAATYRELSLDSTLEEATIAFGQYYPESLGKLWNEFNDTSERRLCLSLVACEGPVLDGDVTLSYSVPSQPSGVRLPAGGALISKRGTDLGIRSCNPQRPLGTAHSLWQASQPQGIVLPGSNDLVLSLLDGGARPASDEISEITATPMAEFIAGNCEETLGLELLGTTYVQIWPVESEHVLQLAAGPGSYVVVQGLVQAVGSDQLVVERCVGCESGQLVDCGSQVLGDVDAPTWLRIVWQPESFRPYEMLISY